MSRRTKQDPPAAPPIGENPAAQSLREQRKQQRVGELRECWDKIGALLQEYEAAFMVQEIRTFPQGEVRVTHSVGITSA